MPTVNSIAYKQVMPPALTSDLVIDALSEKLASITGELLSKNQQELLPLYNKHIGESSTYTLKASLISSLTLIYSHLMGTGLTSDKKMAIAIKLIEDINLCTGGFHNRVNNIVLGLVRPKSLAEFLELARRSLIDNEARRHTDEVHAHNRFFIVAERWGYGVQPINSGDASSGALEDASIIGWLEAIFIERYHFLGIFDALLDLTKTELSTFLGYQGRKDEGYTDGVYSQLLRFFQTFFQDDSISLSAAMIINNSDCIIDINHHYFMARLWKKFIDECYFSFSAKELQFYNVFFMEAVDPSIAETKFRESSDILKDIASDTRQLALLLAIVSSAGIINSNRVALLMAGDCKLLRTGFNDPKLFAYALRAFLSVQRERDCAVLLKRLVKKDGVSTEANTAIFGILMMTVKNHPEAVGKMLSAMAVLAEEDKAAILKQVDKDCFNALIGACCRFDEDSAMLILFVMGSLQMKDQREILLQTNAAGENALLLAASCHPRVQASIISVMKRLTVEDKTAILNQVFSGYNALMVTAAVCPEGVAQLILAMEELKIEDQAYILKQVTDKDHFNALMLAVREHPQSPIAIVPIFSAMARLYKRDQAVILKQITKEGMNVLMLAALHHPKAVSPILAAVKMLEFGDQVAILKQMYMNKWNALMLAAWKHPEAVAPILSAMKCLTLEDQTMILTQVDKEYDCNALMYAIWLGKQLIGVKPILATMSILSLQDQAQILKALNKQNQNALIIAAMYQPEFVTPILMCMQKLPVKEQAQIFKGRGNMCLQDIFTLIPAHLQPSFVAQQVEINMQLLLDELDEAVEKYKCSLIKQPMRNTNEYNTVLDLRVKMQHIIGDYQCSDRSNVHIEKLSKQVIRTMRPIDNKSILVEMPSVNEMLAFIHGTIGISYATLAVAQSYFRKKSHFFVEDTNYSGHPEYVTQTEYSFF